jgi:hypothetical protein
MKISYINNIKSGDEKVSKYSELTIEQIRFALDCIEENYSKAVDSEEYGLAEAFLDQIYGLRKALIGKLIKDPYTTDADVRYFEGQH